MKIITRTRKTGEYLGYYILEDNEEVKVQEFEELPYKESLCWNLFWRKREVSKTEICWTTEIKRTRTWRRTQKDERASRTSKQSHRRLGYEKCRIVGDKNACLY